MLAGAFHCISMSESDCELSVGAPSPISAGDDYGKRNVCHIDGEDLSSSSGSESNSHTLQDLNDGSTQDSNGAMNRNPTCSLCRNHGLIRKLKGHKRYCPWKTCPCDLCRATNKKRRVNAAQVALRRAQAQDEQMGIINPNNTPAKSTSAISPVRVPTPTPKPPSRSIPTPVRSEVKEPAHQPSAPRDELPKPNESLFRAPSSTASPLRPPTVGCQPGPVAFGQQLSLGSILLGQTASFLRESLRDPQVKLRLGPEVLPFLDHVIREALAATEEVSFQLNEVQKELHHIFFREPIGAKNNMSVGSYPHLAFSSDISRNMPMVPPPVNPYNPFYSSQFRAPVIVGPRMEHQSSHFQQYGTGQ